MWIKIMLSLCCTIVLFLVVACGKQGNLNDQDVMWKHCSGASIGDVLNFSRRGHRIFNDTIYNAIDTPVAIIEKVKYRLLADNVLLIKTIQHGERGRYCEK